MNSLPVAAAPSVPELLEQLKSAPASEIAPLERALQLEWSKSGSSALDLLLRRGMDALQEQDLPSAIEHFSALTDHAPEFAQGWFMRATAYFQSGRIGPAFSDIEHALRLNPNNYEAIFALGAMMMEFEQHDLAQNAFEQVLRLHPHHENATKAIETLAARGIGRRL